MKKSKIISLLASTALVASVSSAVNAQVTISGSFEVGYLIGDAKLPAGGASLAAPKTLSNETNLRIASKGKMTNGMEYNVFQDIDSKAAATYFATRELNVTVAKGIVVGYSHDSVKGSEIARNVAPAATKRALDITGKTGIPEIFDVTSSENFLFVDFDNILGGVSKLSVAAAPNLSQTNDTNSDRFGAEGNGESGYAVGYTLSPISGLTIGLGYTKRDHRNPAFEDPRSVTAGIRFSTPQFAIGAQKYKNEGQATGQAAAVRDDVVLLGATFNATKDLTFGLSVSEMERSLAGVKSSSDTKATALSVGYSLGPVVLSADVESAENIPAAANSAPVNARDLTTYKLQVKANF